MRTALRISLLALSLFLFCSLTACSDSETAPVSGDECTQEGATEDGLTCQDGQWVQEEELDAGHGEDTSAGDLDDTGSGDLDDTGSGDLDDTGGTEPDATPCEAETDEEFCTRHQVECGSFTARDDCDVERTVDCETYDEFQCPDHTECHLAQDSEADTNLCLCPPFGSLDRDGICELFNAECGLLDFQELCPEWDPVDEDLICGECGTNSTCHSGECRCDDDFDLCDGECVDLESDVDHCGSCDNSCGTATDAEAQCTDGECHFICDDPDLDYCDSDPTGADLSACTDLTTDDNNCGACGVTCEDGTTCRDGQCECPDDCCSADDCGQFSTCCNGSCISNTVECIDDECTSDDQCKDGFGCRDGECVCESDCCEDSDCSNVEQCCHGECTSSTLFCPECHENDDCPDLEYCCLGNCTDTPICGSDGCTDDDQCDGLEVCNNGQCECNEDCCTDDDCGETAQCCPDGQCHMGTVQCPILE